MAESGQTDTQRVTPALRMLARKRAPHSFAQTADWRVLEEPNVAANRQTTDGEAGCGMSG